MYAYITFHFLPFPGLVFIKLLGTLTFECPSMLQVYLHGKTMHYFEREKEDEYLHSFGSDLVGEGTPTIGFLP